MTPTTRGSYAKTHAVKRGILEACITAFGESGFHGVSMAEIARRAGISHTGLVHHFPDKESILAALLTMQDARAAEYLKGDAGQSHDDPLVVIRGMLHSLADRTPGLVELSVVLSAEAVSPAHPAHEHFRRRYEGVRSFLTRQFTALAGEGRLSAAVRPDALAAITVALVEGLQAQWLYDRTGVDIDAAITVALGAFVPELLDEPLAPAADAMGFGAAPQ